MVGGGNRQLIPQLMTKLLCLHFWLLRKYIHVRIIKIFGYFHRKLLYIFYSRIMIVASVFIWMDQSRLDLPIFIVSDVRTARDTIRQSSNRICQGRKIHKMTQDQHDLAIRFPFKIRCLLLLKVIVTTSFPDNDVSDY